MSGRARGRARGKARQQNEEQARQPGESPNQNSEQDISASATVRPGVQSNVTTTGTPTYASTANRDTGASANPRTVNRTSNVPTEQLRNLAISNGAQTQQRRSDQTIALQTNYFKLQNDSDWDLYQYQVDYNPPIESRSMRIGLLKTHKELLGETQIFDGLILFSPHRLQDVTEVYSTTRNNDERIRITIKLTNVLPPTSPVCIQVYNIIFKKVQNMMDMHQIGRNYFCPRLAQEVPQHRLSIIPGFTTSILQYNTATMLCVDITHKITTTATVLDTMYELQEQSERERFEFFDEAIRQIVGSIVLTRYNNKTYRIDDVEWDKRPSDTFICHGKEISYIDYYKQAYNKTINDPDQPLLISRPKKKDVRQGRTELIYLVPELCFLTGLSDKVRSDFNVMKDVTSHTRIEPQKRSDMITSFMTGINRNETVQQLLSGWRLRFSNELLNINGRVLCQEAVYQRGVQLSYQADKMDWSGDMRGKPLENTFPLTDWSIIFTRQSNTEAQNFVQTLCRVGPPMGITVHQPSRYEQNDNRTMTYFRTLQQAVQNRTQLVVCILQSSKKETYDSIKKFCCSEKPVPSQVVLTRTLKKQNIMSIVTKIAIQLNCKLGGEAWTVHIPVSGTMVVGIDTYHDSAKKGRSVGGIVASINSNFTRYYSGVEFHMTGIELVDNMAPIIKNAMGKYHAENKALPRRIIVYRDGVGDGQFAAVTEHEVPQIVKSFKEVGGSDYRPNLAVVIVKKRISTRLFVRDGQMGMRNPPPGTVVDSQITRAEENKYDFFLVSQSVRQGTVTPTHYHVEYDDSGFTPQQMQKFTYKLTHLYYNWPGTIRVPAPCQYAHKIAFLVGQSIHTHPDKSLADKLFYL